MNKPLAMLLSLMIAMPSFAAGTNINDSLKAYIDAQRQMIKEMRAHPDDVQQLNRDLDRLSSYYSTNFYNYRDVSIADRLAAYQQHFNQVATELRGNGEWSPRKENAWKAAEAKAPSAPILEWAAARQEQVKAEADKKRLDETMAQLQQEQAEKERQARLKAEREQREAAAAAIKAERDAARARLEQIAKEEQEAIAAATAKAQAEREKARAERDRKIESAQTAGRSPVTTPESDEEYTRKQFSAPDVGGEGGNLAANARYLAEKEAAEKAKAEADRVAAETAAKAEAEKSFAAQSHAALVQAKKDGEDLGRAWVQDGPMAMARIAAQRDMASGPVGPSTTAAGATRKQDEPAARPIAGRTRVITTTPEVEQTSTAGPTMTQAQIYAEIKKIAKASGCIGAGRSGHAVTEKYLLGLTYGYARAMCRSATDPVRTAMTGTRATQIASADGRFQIPSNDGQLNTIFQNILSLGLYESDGRFGEGRDRSAGNYNGHTTEAGFLQTSYNVHKCNQRGGWAPAAHSIIKDYQASPNACGKELMNGGSNERNYGSGAAFEFQKFARTCPLGAVEHAAVTLKNCPQHYGPWNTGRAKPPVPRCANVFKQVAEFMNKNRGSNCEQVAMNPSSGSQIATRQQGGRD